MGKPHIEHSGIMKINNLQSSLTAKIKFEASSRLSWAESHQVLHLTFPALALACPLLTPPSNPLTSAPPPFQKGSLRPQACQTSCLTLFCLSSCRLDFILYCIKCAIFLSSSSLPHSPSVVSLVLGSENGVAGNDLVRNLMLGFIRNGTNFHCKIKYSKNGATAY